MITRLERRNRTDILFKNQGNLLDAFDNTVKEAWRITDDEYDYLLDLDLGAEKHIFIDENSTRKEIKESITFINTHLKNYEQQKEN